MTEPEKRTTGISPFIVLGVLVVLMTIFMLMAMDSIKEHDARIVDKLTAKGTFLIRAFEAGTRTGMMTMKWRAARVQNLLTETAFQPEVKYLMITTRDGKILAHSDPEKIGTVYGQMPEVNFLDDGTTVFHREISPGNGGRAFEVFKVFTPAKRFHRPGPGERMGRRKSEVTVQAFCLGRPPQPQTNAAPASSKKVHDSHHLPEGDWFSAHFSGDSEPCRNPGPQVIFAGLDMAGAVNGKRAYINHIIINGAVLFLMASVGIVGLFMLQGYRSTRSSLSRVTAFSNRLVETMPAGLIAVDLNLEITSWNREAMVILGENCRPVLPVALVEMAAAMGDKRQKISRELVFPALSGGSLVLDVVGSPIRDDGQETSGYLFLFRDLTELAALKQEVERSRRLAAVGKLAAGVAHEIRNPLSSIKGFATYFRERYKGVAEDRETADIMIHEVERLNRAITQLLEFARPVPVVARPVDVKTLVAHSLKLVENDLNARGIGVEKTIPADQEPVITDPDRLNQILLNLYLNAIQAMDNGGTLGVKAVTLKKVLSVEVSDTGSGIAPADMEKIFDPYYTTRARGTGLGLAMVHRNLEAMGADIRVESIEGQGTTFFIKIPCLDTGETQ